MILKALTFRYIFEELIEQVSQNIERKKPGFKKNLELLIDLQNDSLESSRYVNYKLKFAKQLGIKARQINSSSNPEVLNTVLNNNNKPDVAYSYFGYILQLPAPYEAKQNLTNIFANKYVLDVDYLSQKNKLDLQQGLLPPTILAIDIYLKTCLFVQKISTQKSVNTFNLDQFFKLHKTTLIDIYKKPIDLQGLVVAVLGQGELVGKPLLNYLNQAGASIISLNEFTARANPGLCSKADILITAAGVPGLVGDEFLNPAGQIIIDAATTEAAGKVVGDLNLAGIQSSFVFKEGRLLISPSPGGVGSFTVRAIFYNLLKLYILTLSYI